MCRGLSGRLYSKGPGSRGNRRTVNGKIPHTDRDLGTWWVKVTDNPQPAYPARQISGFHTDELGDWVADLECGHTRHVRHHPPWQNRPWVISKSTRNQQLGKRLVCKKCLPQLT